MNEFIPESRFAAFTEALYKQGGRSVERRCLGTHLPETNKLPAGNTTGCGGLTLCAIPYQGEDGEDEQAIVCAVDDMAYKFPRFQP